MSKYKNKKSRCPKKYDLTAKEVSKLAGCSVSAVKQIRTGNYSAQDSSLAKRVLAIDEVANSSKSLLIKEIEKAVKL